MSRKQWEKEKLLVTSNSPFPTVFSKDFNRKCIKTRACWERVNSRDHVVIVSAPLHVFPGFLTETLTQISRQVNILTCVSAERRKVARKKVCLKQVSNPHAPGHESD